MVQVHSFSNVVSHFSSFFVIGSGYTDTQTHRHTDTQTHRHTDTHFVTRELTSSHLLHARV